MWELTKEAYRSFARRGGRLLAGAIAFYTLLSMAPIMVIALYVTSLVASEANARAELVHGFSHFIGRAGAETAVGLLDRFQADSSGPLVSVANAAVLLYASTRLFGQLKRSLNTMWDVEEIRQPGIGSLLVRQLRKRLASFVMVLLVCVLLMTTVMAKAALSAASHFVDAELEAPLLWQAMDFVASVIVVTVVFAAIYKLLPDVRIAWRDIWVGAGVTAVLFTIGEVLIGLYLGHTRAGSLFGAAGSVVVLLIWVHYSAQVFFLGAAFTGTWARRRGSGMKPTSLARPRPEPAEEA